MKVLSCIFIISFSVIRVCHCEVASGMAIDTTQEIIFWRINECTGDITPICPDTSLTDYSNRTNAEGKGVSIAYLGNLGLPMESRVFFERDDRSQFMFNDGYFGYMRTPGQYAFINTKIPHTIISHQRAGRRQLCEERLQIVMAINLGKKLNLGFDMDYLYARGFYQSQSAKHWDWVFFGNYLSDHHQIHLFINPINYINAENGGIVDDKDISHPETKCIQINTRDIQTQLGQNNKNTTWNQIKNNCIYLNYRYNFGFKRKLGLTEDGNDTIYCFIPVSSIIYTFDYNTAKKKFYTIDSMSVADFYINQKDFFQETSGGINDSTSYSTYSQTFALSLRQGFNQLAQFNLTAFVTQDFRYFTLMNTLAKNREMNVHTTYIGSELTNRIGKILRYSMQGSLGVFGYNTDELNLSSMIEVRIPVWDDNIASISGTSYLKYLKPTYYEQHYRSRYFCWDKQFDKVKKYFFGGSINIPLIRTLLNIGVENLTKYIFFNQNGYPEQYSGEIQVSAAQLNQDFQWNKLHWDNQLVFQKTDNQNIIPLPAFAVYSSLYIHFKITKVLAIQTGSNIHYWTKYNATTYEPAIQQFRLQKSDEQGNRIAVGNYPLLSVFINCHLKQTRFFIEYYNVSPLFISPPEYFSLPHYPINPTILKFGLSVDFIN